MQWKRLDELTLADLERNPVWRYVSNHDDEAAWVTATAQKQLSEAEAGTFIAATEFSLADGTTHLGFCSPADWSGLDYIQPVIVTNRGFVRLWIGPSPNHEEFEDQFLMLGNSHSSIFPLFYRCLVPVDGSHHSGRVRDLQQLI